MAFRLSPPARVAARAPSTRRTVVPAASFRADASAALAAASLLMASPALATLPDGVKSPSLAASAYTELEAIVEARNGGALKEPTLPKEAPAVKAVKPKAAVVAAARVEAPRAEAPRFVEPPRAAEPAKVEAAKTEAAAEGGIPLPVFAAAFIGTAVAAFSTTQGYVNPDAKPHH